MGWSLKGILQGAAQGAVDWAVRGQVADLQAERDAAQFERSKELAKFNDELTGARTERTLELQQKFKDKADLRERDSVAENNTLAGEYASGKITINGDPGDGKGAKPGTKEYHARAAEFLAASGRPELAKEERTIAEKYDDNEIKREQNSAVLAAAASRRASGGGSSGEGGAFDIDAELTKIGNDALTFEGGDEKSAKGSGKMAARGAYLDAMSQLTKDGEKPTVEMQKQALGIASNIVSKANIHAANTKSSFNDSLTAVKVAQKEAVDARSEEQFQARLRKTQAAVKLANPDAVAVAKPSGSKSAPVFIPRGGQTSFYDTPRKTGVAEVESSTSRQWGILSGNR